MGRLELTIEVVVVLGFDDDVLLEVDVLELTDEVEGLLEEMSGTEVTVGVVGFISKTEVTGACCSYLLEAPSTIF